MKRRTFFTLSSSALAVPAPASQLWAQNWPDKPITMVVPAPPGGGTDLVARMYSDLLTQELGQQVLVDNKGGGNGNVGTAIVARAKPDGYTLLMQYSAYHSANPALIKDLNWKPDDFTGVAMGAVAPHVIVIAKKVPADTLKDFIAYAKANQDKMQFASAGAGSASHVSCILLNAMLGLNVTHVPYRGLGPAMQDLIAGRVQYICDSVSTSKPQIDGGHVKGIATTGLKRSPALPDVPAIAEASPGFEAVSWWGIVATKGTPADVVNTLYRAIAKGLKAQDTQAFFANMGVEAAGTSPREFGAFIQSEKVKWGKVVKESGARPD